MPLLTALIVKNSHIMVGIYYISLKNLSRPNLKAFNIKLGLQRTNWESSYQVRRILALFYKLFALLLCQKPLG